MKKSNVQVGDAVEQAESQLGPIEVSICCAGVAHTGKSLNLLLLDLGISQQDIIR